MGFMILPLAVVVFFVGLTVEFNQMTQAVAGAGKTGQMVNAMIVSAQRAEIFGAACLSAAIASPGLISANIDVISTLPPGTIAPASAVCMTEAVAGGGRSVYSYTTEVPGEAGQVMADTQMNESWFQVDLPGEATNLAISQPPSALPATVPVGTILKWVQITP